MGFQPSRLLRSGQNLLRARSAQVLRARSAQVLRPRTKMLRSQEVLCPG